MAPDYHVTVDYMRYAVPFRLIGEQVDVRLTDTAVTVMAGGGAVAEHGRLRGRRGQYSTVAEHMPPARAAMDSPWSPERFSSWGRQDRRRDPGRRWYRLLAGRPVVEQAFVPARNILGLSKSYSPELLERARRRAELHRAQERDTRDQGGRRGGEGVRAPARGGRRARRPREVGRAPARRRRLPEGRRPRMLTEEHFDMLTKFRVRAMGDKLREMVEDDSYDRYSFEERMEMLIEAEAWPAATARSPSSCGRRGSSSPPPASRTSST